MHVVGRFNPYLVGRDRSRNVAPHYEIHQPVGMGTPYDLVYQEAGTPPWFPPVDLGSCGYIHGYPSQANPYPPYMLPVDYSGFTPCVGGVDLSSAADYNTVSTHGGAVRGYEDHGGFPRCDANLGDPIHLTTNISVVSPVSSCTSLRRFVVIQS